MGPVRRRAVVLVSALAALLAVSAAPAAAAPPSTDPPTGLRTTSVTASAVALSWAAASGATSYQVLRATPTTSLTVVATTTSTSYVDSGRSPGTTYTYAVTAVRKKGTSAPSATVTVTTVPAAPATLTATATSTTTAVLGWSAATGTTSYQVWRATGSGAFQLRTTVAADALSFTDTGLAPASTYRWTVRASNGSGTSGDSPVATATTPPLPKATPTVAIRSSANPSVAGDTVVFTVTLSGPNGAAIPTGSVSFTADGQTSTATLTPNGAANFSRVFAAGGSYPLSASYAGDSRYTGATTTGSQTVTTPAPATLFGPFAAYPTGSWPASVVAADVDGDGQDEAVLSTQSYASSPNDYSLLVHHFSELGTQVSVTRVATGDAYVDTAQLGSGDLDGDGTYDIVLAADGSVKAFLGSADGLGAPLVTPVAGAVWDLVVAELTGDSHPDVLAAVKTTRGAATELLAGKGDGTFQTPVDVVAPDPTQSPAALAVGDVSGDGHDDVVLLWRSSRQVQAVVDFGLQTGGAPGHWDYWSLATLTGSEWPEAVAVGDVTGDGRPDAVVTAGGNRPSAQLIVVPTDTNGRWGAQDTLSSYDIPEPVVVADVDRDGRADVVTAHGGWNRVGVYQQTAGGGLAAEQLYEVPYASHYEHRGLAVGDVTGDGRPDALLADYNHGLVVLPGTCPAFCGT